MTEQQWTGDRLKAIEALNGYGDPIEDDRLNALEHMDATPNEQLRELVEKWRNDSDYMDTHRENYKSPEVTELAAEVIDDLSDELEGLINNE